MSNASQRPTGTQGPLHYAPRRIRDTQQPRDASTTLPANTVPSRVDEVGAESDGALPDGASSSRFSAARDRMAARGAVTADGAMLVIGSAPET
jgi:hypothetical protein